ncbi:MAG: hypothetical protein QE263_00325 [Vampirovibrionales bacterium]|nr:hypothetical protein [Vampirovibrionales bacterium]
MNCSPYSLVASKRTTSILVLVSLCGGLVLSITGCGWQELMEQSTALNGTPFAYRKSVAELNQKAADLLQQGDAAGAVTRLEAARDLAPNDSGILYNLAIATSNWAGSQPEKTPQAIELLEQFAKQHPNDGRFLKVVQSLAVLYEREANRIGAILDPENTTNDDGTKKQLFTALQKTEQQALQVTYTQKAIRCYQTLKERGDANPIIDESIALLEKKLVAMPLPGNTPQGAAQ